MNPGICYLYEYQNKKRRRNAGFLKVARHYQSCILQLHIRGISAGNGASLELWAFCLHGSDMVGTQIASLTCFNRTVSARLPVSESTFPEGTSLPEIDGFLVRFPGGNPPVFWIASDQFLDADPAAMREPVTESQPDIEPDVSPEAPEPIPEDEPPSDSSNVIPADSDAKPSAENESPAKSEPSEPETVPEPAASPDASSDVALSSEVHPAGSGARKIQRSDLSRLPRKFWSLANNSFLLHGYHNYAHLLLVEENDHIWLGVPGIYDPREARAAELFGFPQFTRDYIRELDLSEEERNDDADFGHWCRYLDQAK